jgi:DNA-binding SARP family transcriptional activator
MPLSRPHMAAGGLSIRLLGEIRVQRGAVPVALPPSKRTRALLGFLAATGTPQPRQTLCDLLWDGPDDPRAALRWSLTKLRPLVNDADIERLTADREHVSLTLDRSIVDIGHLDDLLDKNPDRAGLADLEAACSLLKGEFLDGLDLPSCYRFHHWCLAERERWGVLRRRVLSLVLDGLSDNPARALPYARTMVAADPLSEPAHARLVALLAGLGRRKDAQDHYVYARDMLRREMGAPLAGDLKPPAPPHRRPSPDGVAEALIQPPVPPPLADSTERTERGIFGRVAEQQAIDAALDGLLAGAAPEAMLFMGEPGIGKSRLLEFAATLALEKGARVVACRCFEAEAVRPFSCWADALATLIEETSDAPTRRDLALFLPSGDSPANDEGSRTRLFAAVMTLLTLLATGGPLILIIDDLQWIDEASSSLLHYVLRAFGKPGRFLFLGAARTDEVDDNPWCKRAMAALAQDGAVKRIKLRPLGAEEAARFFSSGADAADIASALRTSGGNPLFLTELAKAGRQAPGRDLDTLIGDRIARLDGPERDLIVYASATARDFKPELLGAAMDLADSQLIERIHHLERRGLLKPGGDGRFDFTHDLIRQATYRSLSQPRRRLIHRQIARALQAAAQQDRAVTGELAYHAGAAGDHALAVQAAIAAGEHSLALFANTAAIDAADRGIGHLLQLPIGPDRARWHLALLKVKVFAGASPGIRVKSRLLDELKQAVEAAELLGLRDNDAAIGWHMISWSAQRSNDTSSAAQAILRAEELTRPMDDATRCQQLASTGRCLLEVERDVPRARLFLGDAERLAATLGQSFVELDWGRGLIARWDGDLTNAEASMRRALTLARLREDRWREIECLVWMAKIAVESRRIAEIGAFCDEIDIVADRIGDGDAPVADALRAVALMLDASEAGTEPPLAALRALDDKAQLAYVLNQISACRLDRDQLDGAFATATEALKAAHAVKRTTEIIVATSILACIEARRGHARGTRGILETLPGGSPEIALLSARAREFLERARESAEIPTAIQTGTPHPA